MYLYISSLNRCLLHVLCCPSLCSRARDPVLTGRRGHRPVQPTRQSRRWTTRNHRANVVIFVTNKRKQSNQEGWGKLSDSWAEVWRKGKDKVILPINSKVLASLFVRLSLYRFSGSHGHASPHALPVQCEAAYLSYTLSFPPTNLCEKHKKWRNRVSWASFSSTLIRFRQWPHGAVPSVSASFVILKTNGADSRIS